MQCRPCHHVTPVVAYVQPCRPSSCSMSCALDTINPQSSLLKCEAGRTPDKPGSPASCSRRKEHSTRRRIRFEVLCGASLSIEHYNEWCSYETRFWVYWHFNSWLALFCHGEGRGLHTTGSQPSIIFALRMSGRRLCGSSWASGRNWIWLRLTVDTHMFI